MPPDERGFALLEVLVAFVIAALALGVLFKSSGSGLASVVAAGHYQEATTRAESHLAAIGRDVSLQEGLYEGDDGGGYRWRIRITPVATATPPAAPPPATGAPPAKPARPATLYAIDVGISWREDGRTREVVLRTARVTARLTP